MRNRAAADDCEHGEQGGMRRGSRVELRGSISRCTDIGDGIETLEASLPVWHQMIGDFDSFSTLSTNFRRS